MIDFQKICDQNAEALRKHLQTYEPQTCEYSFVNLSIWGRQKIAFVDGFLTLFSQFERKSIYPFPLGEGDLKSVLDKLMEDARQRGILFRLTSLTAEDCKVLEELYPKRFQFHSDRDGADYVYEIEKLATLSGKRYQSKRNFANRFWNQHPRCQVLPLDENTEQKAKEMLEIWFAQREQLDPAADFLLEKRALDRAFCARERLSLEGLLLVEDGKALAMTMGSPLRHDTFDIHFEKALDGIDGAYAAINQAFASYLKGKYPQLLYLNREDDMGIAGLRKAKLSYHPCRLAEKYWAKFLEDEDEDE